MGNIPKIIFAMIGGAVGWVVEEFQPTFPLVIVAVVFILYDAFTAYQLDKRVHARYPDETKRHEAKFTSFAFGKVIRHTIPKRLTLIFLAYLLEHWVFIHVTIPLRMSSPVLSALNRPGQSWRTRAAVAARRTATSTRCCRRSWLTRLSATLTYTSKISRRNVNANPERRTSNETFYNERNDAQRDS